MAAGRKEFEDVMFTCVADALRKTGIHPKQVGRCGRGKNPSLRWQSCVRKGCHGGACLSV
eukprot:365492-Chlamydomonas_euryale.AAC.2